MIQNEGHPCLYGGSKLDEKFARALWGKVGEKAKVLNQEVSHCSWCRLSVQWAQEEVV
jgi:hypothetical protein